VYGVEDYLKDYYLEGNTIEELLNNIKLSKEKDIGFAFNLIKILMAILYINLLSSKDVMDSFINR